MGKLPRAKNISQERKRHDTISSLHPREFYQENYTIGKQERNTKTYEIKNTDNLDVLELENIFKKKGIHIFGVKAKSNFIGAQGQSSVTFTVRNNEKSADNIYNVESELNKKGFKMSEKQIQNSNISP